MKNPYVFGLVLGLIPFSLVLIIAFMFTVGWERPPVEAAQLGFRGVAMEEVTNPRTEADIRAMNQVPEEVWPLDPDELRGAPLASEVYENVQVLGHLPEPQFTRLMAAITEWVSPEEGCGYCHNLENLADDSVYTKTVARWMIRMTWDINQNWGDHVADTGVTCYTCHRGNHIPANIWFNNPGEDMPSQLMAANTIRQNRAMDTTGSTSLPYDYATAYLEGDQEIRVQPQAALPTTNGGETIQATEQTYALMIHMSEGLGVNCTYCHNSRAFGNWEQSPPARATAWYGIRMARSVNNEHMNPLAPVFPEHRLGKTGDVAKANCATCHNGVNKPLYGVSMLEQYPSLKAAP